MPGTRKKVRITGIITETRDARTFELSLIDDSPLTYKAGQFLTFIFSNRAGEQRRNYSISSSPFLQEPLAITIKRVANGTFSRRMVDNAKVGDTLTTIGAGGFFTLPANPENFRQVFLFAAGSGITPVYSLLKTILYQYAHIRVTLTYSNRSRDETIFYESLNLLQQMFPQQLEIEWLFSNAPEYTKARLSNWLLGELLAKYRQSAYAECLFYLCGPIDYMRVIVITLLTVGVPGANIRKEEFVIVEPKSPVEPPDKTPRTITVLADGQRFEFTSQYPSTILDAARRSGLELPYSCETGRCGTCAAVCTRGQVWMKNNEVLTPDDLRHGRVLTCTGYPVNGDVELDFDQL